MRKKGSMLIVMLVLVLVAVFFLWQGIGMHKDVAKEEVKYQELQNNYYSQSKQIRDSASSDSELNASLVEIKNYPSLLLQLKLVGIGKMLIAIFILLLGILIALIAMPKRLSKILKNNHNT